MASDSELIKRVVQRDSSAFAALMERHGQRIRGHLLRIVRDESAAEDLFQEVFLRLWQRASQWAGRGSVAAWLAQIATRLALNHLRSVRRARQRPLEPAADPWEENDQGPLGDWLLDASALGPEEIASMDEQRAMLRSLMDDLPEERRQILRMVHERQMNVAQAAEALGIPLGTAKSRLHYAVRWLGRRWPDKRGQ